MFYSDVIIFLRMTLSTFSFCTPATSSNFSKTSFVKKAEKKFWTGKNSTVGQNVSYIWLERPLSLFLMTLPRSLTFLRTKLA